MSSADVRDMLDLPNDGHPKQAKKQKTVEKRPGTNEACIDKAQMLTFSRGHNSRAVRLIGRTSSSGGDDGAHQIQG